MGRPILPFALLAAVLAAAAVPTAGPRAQDVFSTTTGGSAPLQGGVSTTEPAAPGHTRPTGTQGVEGNPDCPPPTLADGTTPKNWSCTTRNQGVVGNPDCPAPVMADGTSPKNWSCTTGTQGVEGNPNCPPPALPGGMVPRNWSCAGPDMAEDPLAPLRDPLVVADYRGDPGVPPLMRANAATDEEMAAGAVLTCRRAVVEGIEKPSQAEMADYVCDDQGKALDLPPFQLKVEQTFCMLPLKGAVEELKAGKMLLLKAKDSAGAERDSHAQRGNAHLRQAAAKVGQSDDCMVEIPPKAAAPQRRPSGAQQAAADPRRIARNPCEPVAGMDPRLRGALDANCPRPGKTTQSPPPQTQLPPPPPPPPPLQPQQPQLGAAEDDCTVPQAPKDVRDMLMDWARQLDRNATKLQNASLKATDRFFTGMNEVVQQQLVFLAQEPGKPAGQIAEAVVAYLNNNALENHNKLLADAQKAVEDFVKDPAYASGKFVSNYLIGKVQGGITDRLPGGKFCTLGARKVADETRKLEGAAKAAGKLDEMAKQAEGAADGAMACRYDPRAAAQDRRFAANLAAKRQEEAERAARAVARDRDQARARQAVERQAAQRQALERQARDAQRLKQMSQAERQRQAQEMKAQADRQRRADQEAVDKARAEQAQQIREQQRIADDRRRADQQRMLAEAERRKTPASPEETRQQRDMQQAERQRQVDEARQRAAQQRADAPAQQQAAREAQARSREEQLRLAEQRRRDAEQAMRQRRAAAQPSQSGQDSTPPQGGFGNNPQQAASPPPPSSGGTALRPLPDQATPLNPFGQNQNCMPTSVAADLRKKTGKPYTDSDIRIAGPDEPTTSAEVKEILRKYYGDLQFADHTPARRIAQAQGIPAQMRSSAEIREELLRGGAESRGIVFVRDKATGSGHVVNAERAGGGVSYTDNQSGADAAMWATAIDYSPDLYELFFFRTN